MKRPRYEDFTWRRRGGPLWTFIIGGVVIVVLVVDLYSDKPKPHPVVPVTQLKGTVAAVSGSALAKLADACEITIGPSEERARANGYNCHVKVQCATQVLYGAPGGGTTRCQLRDGAVISAKDTTGAAENDDPLLELNLDQKRIVVSDNGPNTQSTTVELY